MNHFPIDQSLQDEISRFITNRVSNPQDAEDLLQDILIKAYLKQEQLQDASRLRAWLFQIARHTLIDYYRRPAAESIPFDALAETLVNEHLTYEEDFSDPSGSSLSDCVTSLIPFLSDKYRQALVMADLEGQPQTELSQQLGLSYSGVKSRVQRGREQLGQLLETFCHPQLTEAYQDHPETEMQACCL